MAVFDYVVLAILFVSLLLGAWRGLVSEVLALFAWVSAFLAARHFTAFVVPFFSRFVAEPLLQQGGAFVAVFVLTLLLFGLLRLLLRELLHAIGLGLADRTLGAVFGLARGLLIIFLLVAAGGITDMPKQPWWQGASFAPPLETAVLASRPWMPERIAKRIHYR
ncbi:MAG: CvpA family protein [Betaproteobacteria bacterium]|nr:CvpA family protein [Betaproteobacteria bacterium]